MPLETPELGWEEGDIITFRCKDCHDMWYLEVTNDDLAPEHDDVPDWF